MSSIQELKVVRAFRALNTMIQLCHDRGYVIRHPSAIADAIGDPSLYDADEGLDYDWFLRHFVVSPDRAAGLQSNKKKASKSGGADADEEVSGRRGGGGSKHSSRAAKNEEEEEEGEREQTLAEEAEMLRRAANGEWICMRNAMRLSCSVRPTAAAAGAAGHSSAITVKEQPAPTGAVKAEAEDETVAQAQAAAAAAARAASKAAKNALMVFFSGETKLTVKEVQACREKAMKKKAASMIIVTNRIDPGVRLDVQELSGRMDEATGEPLLSIQVFEEEALAFNVVRHETVPTHVAMSPAEAEAFLAAHKLSISQLPRMLESDPLVQYLGLQRGSIVRITREGKQSGPYSMYRHVI